MILLNFSTKFEYFFEYIMKIINTIYFKFIVLPLVFLGVSLCFSYFLWFKNIINTSDTYKYLLFYVSLFAVLEEVIFRFIIQGGLQKILDFSFSKESYFKFLFIFPILLSSILFTLSHTNYSFAIFFLSSFLGMVYFFYKSLFLNIYIHLINNIVSLTILLYYS